MNKQEKNIVNILTFDETENIVDVFANKLLHTDKTVALITNRELVEYAMDYFISNDCVAVKKVDLELDNENAEYMISIDDDGNMIVQPIEYYEDKYFMGIEYAFVDMDGCVEQMTIDKLLDRNVQIVLFGYKDDYDKCHLKEKGKENDITTTSSIYKINGKECSKEDYEKALNELDEMYLDNVQDMLLGYFDFVNEMNLLRRLLW